MIKLLLLFTLSIGHAHELSLFVKLTPAGSFEAKSTSVSGRVIYKENLLKSKKLIVKINSLDTGIDLRNEHMWKHLNNQSFPQIEATNIKGKDNKGSATLFVNGVKKNISFTYNLDSPNKVQIAFQVMSSDFNLKDVQYLGIGVSKTVVINASLDINKDTLL